MNIFESYRGIEFRRIAHQVMVFDWKDFDDWTERYNERTNPEAIAAFSSVILFYGGIGVLVRRRARELMSTSIKGFWGRYEPIIKGDREFFKNPKMWGDIENLYKMIIEIDENPESIQIMRNYFQQLSQNNS